MQWQDSVLNIFHHSVEIALENDISLIRNKKILSYMYRNEKFYVNFSSIFRF